MEATWTLMALNTYRPLDYRWTAKDGQEWTIDRVVAMEADADMNASACGGSHRMYALAKAYRHHLAEGGAIEGAWLKADERIRQAIAAAQANQQADGTFSTNFFLRPSTSDDMAARLGASGHVFEFLTVGLDDEQIQEPWFTRSLVALLDMLERMQDLELECGGLYHSLHGLHLYRERVYGPRTPGATPSAHEAPAESSEKAAGSSGGPAEVTALKPVIDAQP